MILLQVNQLTKHFGADLILSNIKLEVQSNDRIALVGRNGAGKSTLLKIIAGHMSYDGGEIIRPKDLSLGYLAQDTGLESNLSIWEEMLSVFEPLRNMEKRLRAMEAKMGDPDLLNDSAAYEKLMKEYDELQLVFKDEGGYQYEADIRTVLHGLNFSGFDTNTPISTLSGGQKTRLALGKLLLTKPDLLILDEPTNHLDIETLTWLEQYLQGYPGALLIVSHDRYFLDRIVNAVYEISRHTTAKFHGNYSKYLDEKARQYERDLKQYEKQQEQISKLEDFIQRNIARASTTKRAQSRRKQLQKIDKMDRPQGDEKSASFSFEIDRQSGNDVLKINDLSLAYPGKEPLVTGLNTTFNRGDSIALVGPNGAGKSTLLKAIISGNNIISGAIDFGSNVSVGYYDQEQASLKSNKRVLDELWDEYPHKTEKEIRTALGNFLFSGDDVLKPVSGLSGGEKARLALCKLMFKKANFLILDEPTNHLDLDSKEVLESALIDYPGTILFVSHDRYFINRIADRIMELSDQTVTEFLGDYDYYVDKKNEMEELARLEQEEKAAAAPAGKNEQAGDKSKYRQDKEAKKKERQRQRKIEETELRIAELEEQIEEKEALLALPEIYEDHENSALHHTELTALQEELEQLMEEWEALQLAETE